MALIQTREYYAKSFIVNQFGDAGPLGRRAGEACV
jgi:hypothetical protein